MPSLSAVIHWELWWEYDQQCQGQDQNWKH